MPGAVEKLQFSFVHLHFNEVNLGKDLLLWAGSSLNR